jgi:hypothetical protein
LRVVLEGDGHGDLIDDALIVAFGHEHAAALYR